MPAFPGHFFSRISPVLQEVSLCSDRDRKSSALQEAEREQVPDSQELEDSEQGNRSRTYLKPVSIMSRALWPGDIFFISGDEEKSTFLKTVKRVRAVEADTDKEREVHFGAAGLN